MDLLAALSSQLGIDPAQAQALAGGVIGQLKAGLGGQHSEAIDEAVPEAAAWQGAPSGGLGGLLSAMGGGAGGGGALGVAALLAQLSSMGITPDKLAAAAPTVLAFLRTRLPEPLMQQVETSVQGLLAPASAEGEPSGAGGLAGALAGLLGR